MKEAIRCDIACVKTFLPMLLQSTAPGIVNIDSSAALMSLAGTSMYSASKAAL